MALNPFSGLWTLTFAGVNVPSCYSPPCYFGDYSWASSTGEVIPQHVQQVKWSQECLGGMAIAWMRCLHVQQFMCCMCTRNIWDNWRLLYVVPCGLQCTLRPHNLCYLQCRLLRWNRRNIIQCLQRWHVLRFNRSIIAVQEHIPLQQRLPRQEDAALAVLEHFPP